MKIVAFSISTFHFALSNTPLIIIIWSFVINLRKLYLNMTYAHEITTSQLWLSHANKYVPEVWNMSQYLEQKHSEQPLTWSLH